jgi:hypothetical protein
LKFFDMGTLLSKGGSEMKLTGLAITAGIGAAAGAVAILMMPRQNATRRLAARAANKAEAAVLDISDKLAQKMDME